MSTVQTRPAFGIGDEIAFGVDVYHEDGPIDWHTAHTNGGVSFGYAKVSEGATVADPAFPGHWAGMRAANVLRGGYHFFRPKQDATAQAHQFVRLLNAAGGLEIDDLPPALDLEVADGLGFSEITAGALTWIKAVRDATGRTPIVYTYPAFAQESLASTLLSKAGCDLWIAHETRAAAPTLPAGWTEFRIWQTAAGEHKTVNVPGAGYVDINRAAGSLAQLRQALGLPTPSPWALALPDGYVVRGLIQPPTDAGHNYAPLRALLGHFYAPDYVGSELEWRSPAVDTGAGPQGRAWWEGQPTPWALWRDARGTVWGQVASLADWLVAQQKAGKLVVDTATQAATLTLPGKAA